jgi:hypothetical protein
VLAERLVQKVRLVRLGVTEVLVEQPCLERFYLDLAAEAVTVEQLRQLLVLVAVAVEQVVRVQ